MGYKFKDFAYTLWHAGIIDEKQLVQILIELDIKDTE